MFQARNNCTTTEKGLLYEVVKSTAMPAISN